MIFIVRMITPEKHGLNRRIKGLFALTGAKVLSLGAVREMRGMNETAMRFTAPNDTLGREAVASLGQIPGIAILEFKPEDPPDRALSNHIPTSALSAGPTASQGGKSHV